jgi:peroxiredoxin
MKIFVSVILLFITTISFAQTISSEQYMQEKLKKQKETIGKPFPAFTAKMDDAVITNESLKGKTVFVNFWFESCAPCIAEFKGLNQLYDSLKTDTTVAFISFTFETKKTIANVRKKYGLNFPIVTVSKEDCYVLNQQNGFPTNLILATDLTIRHIQVGGNIDIEEARWHLMNRLYPILKRIRSTGF